MSDGGSEHLAATPLGAVTDRRAQRVLDGELVLAEACGVQPADLPLSAQRVVLSRFAWLRRDGDRLTVESSRYSGAVALLHPKGVALVAALAAPAMLEQAARSADVGERAAVELAALLGGCGALVPDDADDEQRLPLAVWEFHDLLFHARSRAGRHANPYGGAYRFAGVLDQAPPLPPARWPRAVELPRPDLERLEREDPPLSAVVSARRSIRRYGEPPVDAGELGELLYRCLRVDDIQLLPTADPTDTAMSYTRPYPSGGALYELECYVLAQRVAGIEPGLYHYAAGEHALELVIPRSAELGALAAREGSGAMLDPDSIQALLLITARMHRIAWKYASLAYALVLKHVGVLYQSLYLAATAMGLAPCAIGGGDSDLFAAVSGIDYYEEPLVGEFALGRAPAVAAPRA